MAQQPPLKTLDSAFQFVMRVADRLKGEGCGLLQKGPGGENEVVYQGTSYSASRVCYPSGQIYKVLTDVPSGNGPTWADNGTVPASRYRPALPVEGADPNPAEPTGDIRALQSVIAALQAADAAMAARLAALEAAVRATGTPARVALRTDNGHYLCAEGGGGGEIHSQRPQPGNPVAGYQPGPWETFTVEPRG